MSKWVIGLMVGTMVVAANTSAGTLKNLSDNASGDIRGGFYSSTRDDRDSSVNTTDEIRLRIRLGTEIKRSDQVRVKARFAGRYSTRQTDSYFLIADHASSTDGLALGESTLDEFYLDYTPSDSVALRVGRMQSKFELQGVAKKSLDSNNSPNTDIAWLDGAHLKLKLGDAWKLHAIASMNAKAGSSSVARSPLNYTDNGSRVSGQFVLEALNDAGPVVQREISVNVMPKALQVDGNAAGAIEDYVTVVGRGAAKWSLGSGKRAFMLAGEIGQALNTQTNFAAGTGLTGDADGLAWQTTANIFNFMPGHSFGLVYAQAGAGWLISPDFRNNNSLIEGRYQVKLGKRDKVEFRLRQRTDLERLTGETRDRVDVDMYLRYTVKI